MKKTELSMTLSFALIAGSCAALVIMLLFITREKAQFATQRQAPAPLAEPLVDLDYEPLMRIMQRYTRLVVEDDGSHANYTPEIVEPLLRDLRLERRKYYIYLERVSKRAGRKPTTRHLRTLKFYVSSIEEAIADLEEIRYPHRSRKMGPYTRRFARR